MVSNKDNEDHEDHPLVTWMMVTPDFYVSYTVDEDPATGTHVPMEWKCRCGRRGAMQDESRCACANPDCPCLAPESLAVELVAA